MPVPTLENIIQEDVVAAPAQETPLPLDVPQTPGPEAREFSRLERGEIAFQEFSPERSLVRGLSEPFHPRDASYNAMDYPELTEGLDGHAREDVLLADSYEDGAWHSEQGNKTKENMKNLMVDGGISAGGYILAATFTSPSMLAGAAAETKALLNISSTASRLRKMVLAGGTLGASAAAMEAEVAYGNPDAGYEDVLYAAMGGAIVGGLMAPLLIPGVKGAKKAAKLKDDIADYVAEETRRVADDVQSELDETLVGPSRNLDEAVDPEAGLDIDMMGRKFEGDEVVDDMGEVVDRTSPIAKNQNVHKAVQEAKEAGELKPTDFASTKLGKIMTRLGLSDSNTLHKMEGSDVVTYINREILSDASGQTGVRKKTASLLKHLYERKHLYTTAEAWRSGYRGWAKARGGTPTNPKAINRYYGALKEEWDEAVYLELANLRRADELGETAVRNTDVHITATVDAVQKQVDDVLAMAESAGVLGYEDITRIAGYVPLKWMGTKINKIVSVKGKGEVKHYKKLLSKGYQSLGMDTDIADKISHAVITRAQTGALGLDTNPARMFAKDSRDALVEILQEGGIKGEDLESMLARIDTKAQNMGKASSARRRTSVDLTVMDDEGRKLLDIVNTDVQGLTTKYTLEMSGRSALARKGIKSDADWQTLKATAVEDISNDIDRAKFIKIMDSTYENFLALPRGGGVNKTARRFSDQATLAYLGMTGAAQAAEFANVVGAHGIMNLLEVIPELKKMRAALKAGNMQDAGVLGEMRAMFGGLWDEQHLSRPEVRLEDVGAESNEMLKILDNVQASAIDKLGYISGMNQIKTYQQQAVVIMQVDKVFKTLANGKLDEKILKRFADVGWDIKTLARLRKEVEKGNVTFQGNGAVDKLNMDKWAPDLIEDFGVGMHTHSNQIIQLGLTGEDAYWMAPTVGNLLTQFRKFPMLAMEKQLARQTRMADTESYMSFMYGLALSTGVTFAKAAALDIGNPKEKTRLDYLMSPEGLISSSMKYSSQLGVLPEVVGGLQKALGKGVGGRHDIGFTPPAASAAFSLVNSAGSALRGDGARATKQFFGGMIWGNALPMQLTNNAIQSAFTK